VIAMKLPGDGVPNMTVPNGCLISPMRANIPNVSMIAFSKAHSRSVAVSFREAK